MPPARRLAAILAADVAGYSRLMGQDEEWTHARLQAHLRELVESKIKEHRGRIVKNTGDGLLAEFASVVDAVRCAVEIQRAMVEREPDVAEERRIRFRIGVNLGDVIVEEHDIFGDGVNVAARLEALAEPGGICISRMVRDQIRDKLSYAFVDQGEQSVKNIARPVRVYAWRSEATAGVPTTSVSSATSNPPLATAPRLSIVVLPFANLSDDREQQYFADAITEDLTTDLSRLAGMLVISRNTAFTYQGKRVDTKQIGRELCVRYVLEGSVRRSGNRVRVNAQLIDAETDAHLWAERFDGDMSDLFALQDEVTSRIAATLRIELVRVEASRPTQNPNALDFILRGRAVGLKPGSRETYAEQIRLFEHALTLEPQSVEAMSLLACALVSRLLNFGSGAAAYEGDLKRAEELTAGALAAAPRDPTAHFAKGQVLRLQGRLEEAISEYETVLASNPNWVSVLAIVGRCKIFIGPIEEAIPAQELAIRLSPRDPEIRFWYFRIGQAHLFQSRVEQAIPWFEKARHVDPEIPFFHAYLASAYALHGDAQQANVELAEARRLDGAGNYSSIARELLRQSLSQNRGARPEIRALIEATYFAGLREAGMPEE
jgi:TolB-like protein/class 3 adenylate cyclase/cytochrome c-type biogenesis protein CcmH/NrfG